MKHRRKWIMISQRRIFKTRLFGILLCLFLLGALLPSMGGTKVFAADVDDETANENRYSFVRISGQGLTESGYYQNNNGVWEKSADNNIPDDHYIHYDRQRHVLTLNNVTITDGNSPILNSGIFVDDTGRNLLEAKEEVYLHIILKGTNTVSGDAGIYMKTDVYWNPYHRAKLKISGPGTLTARGSAGGGSAGIMLQNLDGDVELIVDGANIVAEGHNRYGGYGVYLQHSKTGTGKLTVRGGKLIASSDTNPGIGLFGGSGVKSQGKDRIVVTDSAVVKADGKKGLSFNEDDFSVETGDNGTGGIIFDGKQGTVYGNVTLLEELNIAEGESLIVPNGVSLTIPEGKTLTNHGVITVEEGGKLENKGQIHNRGEIKGKIEGKQLPQVDSEKLTDATVGRAYSTQLTKTNDGTKWSLKEDSTLPNGLTLDGDTGVISGKPTETGDFTFTLLAENEGGSIEKTLSVKVLPVISPVKPDSNQDQEKGRGMDSAKSSRETPSPGKPSLEKSREVYTQLIKLDNTGSEAGLILLLALGLILAGIPLTLRAYHGRQQ